MFADGAALDALEHEIGVIVAQLPDIARETQTDPAHVIRYLGNIGEAIRLARAVTDGIGGVNIG